jgi:hypothetical protein
MTPKMLNRINDVGEKANDYNFLTTEIFGG